MCISNLGSITYLVKKEKWKQNSIFKEQKINFTCQNSPEPGTFGSAEDDDNDLLTDILFNAPVYGKRMSSSLMEQQRRTKMYLQKVWTDLTFCIYTILLRPRSRSKLLISWRDCWCSVWCKITFLNQSISKLRNQSTSFLGLESKNESLKNKKNETLDDYNFYW